MLNSSLVNILMILTRSTLELVHDWWTKSNICSDDCVLMFTHLRTVYLSAQSFNSRSTGSFTLFKFSSRLLLSSYISNEKKVILTAVLRDHTHTLKLIFRNLTFKILLDCMISHWRQVSVVSDNIKTKQILTSDMLTISWVCCRKVEEEGRLDNLDHLESCVCW